MTIIGAKEEVAQRQHLSRHLPTDAVHLRGIFIELFIEMYSCLYRWMHCVMVFCNKSL